MGTISHAQWSGLGFAPFSLPDFPLDFSDHKSSFVTEWSTGVCRDESRASARRPLHCELFLTDPTCWETENPLPVRGECLNISDEGLYGVVPIGYGLAVGQHYLFQLRYPNGETEGPPQLGTIVRAEMLLRQGEDQLGIGVRLGAPREERVEFL